jgi:three-Cys-motif partner protein
MASKFNPIQYVEDDGLPYMEVGNWAQKKYKLVGKYCDIFTSGMKNKWNLAYLDLFSGPGYVKNKSSGQLMRGAGMLALGLPNPFDFYVFNDISEASARALRTRIKRDFPYANHKVFNADANSCVGEMLNSIPHFPNDKGTLIFCFLDPYSLNLDFNTVRVLGQNQVDILVLHALQMDARRNHRIYSEDTSTVVGKFTGNPNWKNVFGGYEQTPTGFMKFVSEEFDRSISNIGYKPADVKERIENNAGAGLYYLCFYSKHDRGIEFFEKIRKTGNDQYELF